MNLLRGYKMNEEQSDNLIQVLREIRNNLKPKKEEKHKIIMMRLQGEFFNSLDDIQKEYINQIDKTLCLAFQYLRRVRKNKDKNIK